MDRAIWRVHCTGGTSGACVAGKENTGVTRGTCVTGIKIKTVYTRYSAVRFSLTLTKRNPIAPCDGETQGTSYECKFLIYRCGHKVSIALWWTAQYGEPTALAVPVAPVWQAKENTGVTRGTSTTGIKIRDRLHPIQHGHQVFSITHNEEPPSSL